MGYTWEGSNTLAEEKDSCGQHSFSHWAFDEVAHDSGYEKGQIEKDQKYSTSLRLSFYAMWWKRMELETMDEIFKGRKRCTGRGERVMWTALFCPLGCEEKGQIEKDQVTPPHFVYPPTQRIIGKYIR